MITSKKQKHYRKTTGDWIVSENGEERIEKVEIEYYPQTVKEMRAQQAALEAKKAADPEAFIWTSELIFPRIHSLPNVIDDETDKPVNITLEWLEDQDVRNLRNLKTAIEEDENPKSQNSVST